MWLLIKSIRVSKLHSLESETVGRLLKVDVTEKEINMMLAATQKQHAEWKEVGRAGGRNPVIAYLLISKVL